MAYDDDENVFLSRMGSRIRELRREKTGLSQEKFAAACGLDRAYVASIERGVRNVSVLILRRIARTLQIPTKELLDGADVEQKRAGRKS